MAATSLRTEVTDLLSRLIQVDTTNPPGNETAAAELLRDYLQANGLQCELYARVPERANLVTRISGRGDGPTLVEAKCERLYPHTSNDDDTRYRSRDELSAIPKRDPVPLFARRLLNERVLDQGILDRIGLEVAREVDEGQRVALAAPEPSGEDVMKHVYGT